MNLVVKRPYLPLYWWASSSEPPYRYYAYSGGRASGKSWAVAQNLVTMAATKPTIILCAREYQNSMADSVYKLLVQSIDRLQLAGFHPTVDSITHVNGSQFIFRGLHNNLQSIKSMEGIDVCWVEEAQTITRESLDVLIPTIRKTDSTIILTWNPLTHDDPVMRRFHSNINPKIKAQTLYTHTTWKDVRTLLSADTLHMIDAAKDTPEYAHIWLGQPYENTRNQIMSWEQLHNATLRKGDDGAYSFGVDIARYGQDRTALAIKHGTVLERLISWRGSSLTDTANTILGYAQQYEPTIINVDDTGVGGGVTDILRDKQQPVRGINYASKAKEQAKYPNIASELWFDYAQHLTATAINPQLDHLPELLQELSTRTWRINSKSQRQVESKADYKANELTGSPDLADAVLLAFYEPLVMPSWDVDV